MSDEKRELASYVAPIVRGTSELVLRRRVKTFDRESGEVTGEVTMRQVLGGLTEVTALEIEVIDGRRPKQFTCEGCGKVFEMPKKGPILKTCDPCRTGGQTVCPCGCGRLPPKNAFAPSIRAQRGGRPWACRIDAVACELCGKMVRVPPHGRLPRFCHSSDGGCERQTSCAGGCGKAPPRNAFQAEGRKTRGGAPWRCGKCAKREMFAQMTPEQRAALAAPMLAISSEQRSSIMRAWAAEVAPELRSSRARAASVARWAASTPERERASKAKGWETRRAKAAAVLPSQDGGAQKTDSDD